MQVYIVTRPFKDYNGAFLREGDTVTCDYNRAAILRANGLIGQCIELSVKQQPDIAEKKVVETATKKPVKRQYRKRK